MWRENFDDMKVESWKWLSVIGRSKRQTFQNEMKWKCICFCVIFFTLVNSCLADTIIVFYEFWYTSTKQKTFFSVCCFVRIISFKMCHQSSALDNVYLLMVLTAYEYYNFALMVLMLLLVLMVFEDHKMVLSMEIAEFKSQDMADWLC